MNEEHQDFTETRPESWKRPMARGFKRREPGAKPDWAILGGLAGAVAVIAAVFVFWLGTGSVVQLLLLFLVLAAGLFIYFCPTAVAWSQNHRNLVGIALLNLFLGWTIIGWVGALVWAVYQDKK